MPTWQHAIWLSTRTYVHNMANDCIGSACGPKAPSRKTGTTVSGRPLVQFVSQPAPTYGHPPTGTIQKDWNDCAWRPLVQFVSQPASQPARQSTRSTEHSCHNPCHNLLDRAHPRHNRVTTRSPERSLDRAPHLENWNDCATGQITHPSQSVVLTGKISD
jgi:hypothetical protein